MIQESALNRTTAFSEIITIGDEILIGQTIDTNSAWLGEKLSQIGMPVRRINSISDDPVEIKTVLADSMERSRLVILTGGLGPTSDDRTKKTLAEFFNSRLVVNEQVLFHIEKLLQARNVPVSQLNRYQALVPESCRILTNDNGTAPGMWFERDSCVVISLPGVPYEMKGIMETVGLKMLAGHFAMPPLLHKTIMTTGIAESRLASLIDPWEKMLPEGFSVAYLPSPGIVKLRITSRVQDPADAHITMNSLVDSLQSYAGQWIYGFDDEPLEVVVGRMLRQGGFTLSTAESCTGGSIASLITSIPGSSAYFKGSVVAYSNEVKLKLLNVPEELLQDFGAVSREVVESMAVGVKSMLDTDFSIAVSGIAGPDGGSELKPVGTVWICVTHPHGIESERFAMGENRGRTVRKASLAALNMLRISLLKHATGN